jgi:hypothetical protein
MTRLKTVEGSLRTDVFLYAVILWGFVALITVIWWVRRPPQMAMRNHTAHSKRHSRVSGLWQNLVRFDR